jgi:hypothetical protein
MPGTNCVEKWDLNGETIRELFGVATLTAGNASVVVTFPQPMMAIPDLTLTVSGGTNSRLKGLSLKTESESTTGFTIKVSGLWHGPVQTKAFTAAGGVNQDSTYTHRTFAQTNSTTAITVRAPAAPAADSTCKWAAVWEDAAPFDLSIEWHAVVPGEI